MENQAPIAENSWLLGIAGVVSILFGLAALIWPGITLLVLVWLYGAFALAYGIVELVRVFSAASRGTTWWTHLVIGLLSLAAGVFVLVYPLISTTVLLFVIAFWAIAIGIMEVVSSLTQAQFLYLVTGVISILFGLVLLSNPIAGALALIWVIGVFSIVRGILLLIQAARVPTETGRTV